MSEQQENDKQDEHSFRTDVPLAWAVSQPEGAEFDYIVYPDRHDAEAAAAASDDELEVVPLYARSATPRAFPATVVERARQIVNEWNCFECDPDPTLEGDACDALLLARAVLVVVGSTTEGRTGNG